MPLSNESALPSSGYSDHAYHINVTSREAAFQSLKRLHEQINPQAKVLFYREGEHLFAVEERHSPGFFKRLFSSCLLSLPAFSYAHTEVGNRLAEHFPDTGGVALQSSMTKWWGKRRKAIHATDLGRVLAANLTRRADNLRVKVDAWAMRRIDEIDNLAANEPSKPAAKGKRHVQSAREEVVATRQELRRQVQQWVNELQADSPTRKFLDRQRTTFNELQFDILSVTCGKPARRHELSDSGNQLRRSLEEALSPNDIQLIEAAGLLNVLSLEISSKWEGDPRDFAVTLRNNARLLNNLTTQLDEKLSELTNHLVAMSYPVAVAGNNRSNRQVVNHDMGYLAYRLRELEEVNSFPEKMSELNTIATLLGKILQSSEAIEAGLAINRGDVEILRSLISRIIRKTKRYLRGQEPAINKVQTERWASARRQVDHDYARSERGNSASPTPVRATLSQPISDSPRLQTLRGAPDVDRFPFRTAMLTARIALNRQLGLELRQNPATGAVYSYRLSNTEPSDPFTVAVRSLPTPQGTNTMKEFSENLHDKAANYVEAILESQPNANEFLIGDARINRHALEELHNNIGSPGRMGPVIGAVLAQVLERQVAISSYDSATGQCALQKFGSHSWPNTPPLRIASYRVGFHSYFNGIELYQVQGMRHAR